MLHKLSKISHVMTYLDTYALELRNRKWLQQHENVANVVKERS